MQSRVAFIPSHHEQSFSTSDLFHVWLLLDFFNAITVSVRLGVAFYVVLLHLAGYVNPVSFYIVCFQEEALRELRKDPFFPCQQISAPLIHNHTELATQVYVC